MQIQELMHKPVVTCQPTDHLNDAARLMWEHDIGALPIVDDRDSLVGMITDRDIAMAAYTQGRPLDSIEVAGVMANQVYSCSLDDSVEHAERLMGEMQVRRIPVVADDNRLVGLLSLNDIARFAAGRKANGRDRDVTQTLAAICKPRSMHDSSERTAPVRERSATT